MLHTITRAVVIAAIATSGILAGTGAVRAAAPAVSLTSVTAVATGGLPSSQIKGAGPTRKFVPSTVTAAPATGTCGSANYSFLITNSTKTTQQVLYAGAKLGKPIKPKLGLYVCADEAGNGTLTLLHDAKAKLTFTIT